ncbi:MAG: hypothetical protein HYY03_08415 [Chloroflexi bacterium]|nr:hypothetical protein [Chloroflexota bacterium]
MERRSPALRRAIFLAAIAALLTLLFALSGTGGTRQTTRIRWADVTIDSPTDGRISVDTRFDYTYGYDPQTLQLISVHGEPVIQVGAYYTDTPHPGFSKIVRIDAGTGQIIGVWSCEPQWPKLGCDPLRNPLALASDGAIDIDAVAAVLDSPELVSVVKSARYEPRYSPTAPWPWNGPPPSERISLGKISIAKPDPASGFTVYVGPPKILLTDPPLQRPPRPSMSISNGISVMGIDAETGSYGFHQVIFVDRPFFENIISTLQVQP